SPELCLSDGSQDNACEGVSQGPSVRPKSPSSPFPRELRSLILGKTFVRRASEEVGAEFAESLPGEPWAAAWTVEGVIGTLEPLASDERQARIQSVVGQRLGSVTVLLDARHDPHNGSAVMRTCDAFGVPTVHVLPRVEAFMIARRITKGTERW